MTCRRFVLIGLAASAAVASGNGPAVSAPQQEFLGYRLGEERIYVLGPQEEIYGGESALWTIQLDEIREGDPTVGVFDLGFERSASMSAGSGQWAQVAWATGARVTINAYGFPLTVRWEGEVESPGGLTTYSARYDYDGDSYDKTVKVDGEDRDLSVHILNHDDLDRTVPTGLYLFTPPDSGCVGVTTGSEGRGVGACGGRDQIFANPGLLSLTMPALWERGTGEAEFLLLTPDTSGVRRRGGRGAGGLGPGGSSTSTGSTGRGLSRVDRASGSFDRFEMKSEDSDQIQLTLGPRTAYAWKLEASSPVEAIYVDGNGKVLRIDLERQPDNTRNLHVRLLSPTEY